jgi:hypothetical protein
MISHPIWRQTSCNLIDVEWIYRISHPINLVTNKLGMMFKNKIHVWRLHLGLFCSTHALAHLEFGQEKKINTQTQGKKITLSFHLLVSMSRVELENEIKEG